MEDNYSEILISDSKFNIKSCNSAGDKYYSLTDPEINRIISKSPSYNKFVDGEKINIVGLHIHSSSKIMPEIVNGEEHIINNGEKKIYPRLYNCGENLNSLLNFKSHNSNKITLIENFEDLSLDHYHDENDIILLFNSKKLKSLTDDEFNDILEQILPSVKDIMNIEKDTITHCTNMIELQRILNKYLLSLNQVSSSVLSQNRINFIFKKNINKLNNYEKYVKQQYLKNKSNMNLFTTIYNALLKFKNMAEYKIGANISNIPVGKYYDDLKLVMIEYTKSLFDQQDSDN